MCTGPVTEVSLTAPKQLFSQAALPEMVPPASRMRVTRTASTRGVQARAPVPLVQGTPARAMLSLRVMVLPASSCDVGRVQTTVALVAQPPESRSDGGGRWMEVRG